MPFARLIKLAQRIDRTTLPPGETVEVHWRLKIDPSVRIN
jgi:hypothetical protein